MTLTEKAAYLKGLIEGYELNNDSKEGKVYTALIDLLDDLAMSVEDTEAGLDELYEVVEEIDHDLGEVEEELYCDCDDDCDCDCDECDCDEFAVTCPNCENDIALDYEDIANEETITCPCCGEILELEFDCDCDCDCDCEE